MLDLSYNNLSSNDILNLGMLPNLRVLHLSGNNITDIPADMSLPPKRTDARYTRLSANFMVNYKFICNKQTKYMYITLLKFTTCDTMLYAVCFLLWIFILLV